MDGKGDCKGSLEAAAILTFYIVCLVREIVSVRGKSGNFENHVCNSRKKLVFSFNICPHCRPILRSNGVEGGGFDLSAQEERRLFK